ncbi:MAG: Gmad2 immunoglobulin-like domain-containing protein [Dehalococcoidia bacterium]|nr:Gmad2 immunoglobulin-like domain-containing protein [Dehalococcoidia bacterium]
MTRHRLLIAAAAALALLGAACATEADPTPAPSPTGTASATATETPTPAGPTATPTATETAPPAAADCEALPAVLLDSSFVLVTSATAGTVIEPGTEVSGCSRTFESHVGWRLLDRDGNEIAAGFTMGGGVDGAGAFTFVIDGYSVAEPQVGHLEVNAPDPSDGEGFPPSQHRFPVVLLP